MTRQDQIDFHRIFKVPFSQYHDKIPGLSLGLDVVKFDDEVIHSGDRPMVEVIKEKYGDGAVALIERML